MTMAPGTFDEVTGPMSADTVKAGTGFAGQRTGTEYGAFVEYVFARFHTWGVEVQLPPSNEILNEETVRAARERPFVSSSRPEVTQLTGNLVADIRATSGLTNTDLATLLGTTERTVAEWRRKGKVPDDRRKLLEALRAVGAILVGGLGRSGAKRWLTEGPTPPIELLLAGHLDEVLARARGYETSVAD
jgi:DNA-binding transcriptional regulator YiaG